MSEFVKAVEIATGNITYVPEHHLDLYPKLLKPAPSQKAAATNPKEAK